MPRRPSRQVQHRGRSAPSPASPQFHEVEGEAEADQTRDAFLSRMGREPTALALALGRTDGATRAYALSRLQQEQGNAYVQRVMAARQPGWAFGPMRLQRYEAGEHAKTAGEPDKQAQEIDINGVKMTYGEMIAMGDMFDERKDLDDLKKEPKDKLQALVDLIRKDVKTGKVSTAEWQQATDGRYTDLATKNATHFAPSNLALAPEANTHTSDHQQMWQRYHRKALDTALKGDKNDALALNAFGDHFLTDAFAAGHLINKEDIMAKFQADLAKVGESFFNRLAQKAWANNTVSSLLSKYETVAYEGYVFRPNINSADRFSQLLQAIHKERPDVLQSSAAKAVHDKLNTMAGGIEVENNKGDKWHLSGDTTMNAETLTVARKAVARSRQNVLDQYDRCLPLNPLQDVWDYVPHPTPEGLKVMQGQINLLTDPNRQEPVDAIAQMIIDNIATIVDELVKLKKLKLA